MNVHASLRCLFLVAGVGTLLGGSSVKTHAASAYSDDASNYTDAYAGKNVGTGFGPFVVVANNAKPPYAGTFIASAGGTESNQGNPNPESINTSGRAFGFYANLGSTASVTISRSFTYPMQSTEDSFSINLVTGLNDAGEVGITLYTSKDYVGAFSYIANQGYTFSGKAVGSQFVPGALHLLWTVTSPGHLSFRCSGALTCSGSTTFSGTITGFKVYCTNSGAGGPTHDGYFNSISEIVAPVAGQN